MESASEDQAPSTSVAGNSIREPTSVDSQDGRQDYILERVRGTLFRNSPAVTRIGRFALLEEIGQGGMGMVHAAYDEQLDRKIAIKFLHQDELPTEDLRLRFLREAQALARLSHPNVVTVHAVEEHDEQMYLAMEFVRGEVLASWLERRPPWQDVLEAFVLAGRGLVAAHDAGLVHRDFKPHNVMRDEHGGVKVLDFGLARSVDTKPNESPTGPNPNINSTMSLTEPGAVMGTPAYMSPEQHLGMETDARSDQYSFCVATWEGLAGERPFHEPSYDTLIRAKAAGPPSWPQAAAPVPRRIVDALRRGMAPRADERWPSMQALLDALRLEPRGHRLRWWLGLSIAALAGLGAGVIGLQPSSDSGPHPCSGAAEQLVGVWDSTRRSEVEAAILGLDRTYAADVWTRASSALDDYANSWVAMHTDACEATAIRHEQSSQVLDLRMECLRRTAGELRATVDALTSADATTVERAHELTDGLPPLSRCANVEALTSELEPPLPAEAEAVSAAREALARARSLERAGRYEESSAAIEDATEQLIDVEYGPIQTEAALVRGQLLNARGQYEESEAALTRALKQALKHEQRDALRSAAMGLIDVVGSKQRRMDEGLRYQPLVEGLSTGDPIEDAELRHRVAIVLHDRGDEPEAEAEVRAALSSVEQAPGSHPLLLASLRQTLSMTLRGQGKNEEAEAENRAALTIQEQALGPSHPIVAYTRSTLGNMLAQQGKIEEAEAEYRAALSVLDEDHPQYAKTRVNLGTTLKDRGNVQQAEAEFRAAMPLLEKALGPDHPSAALSRISLAGALKEQGEMKEAEALLRTAVAILEKKVEPDHIHLVGARINLANTLAATNQNTEAEQVFRQVLSVIEGSYDPDHFFLAGARSNFAALLVLLERYEEALPLLEFAWTRFQRDDVRLEHRAQTAFTLARTLWNISGPRRDRERAHRLAEESLRLFRELGREPDRDAQNVVYWLDRHPAP